MLTITDMPPTRPDLRLDVGYAAYTTRVRALMDRVDTEVLETIAATILAAWRHGRTLYLAGNGGSAATASHFAVDLGSLGRRCPDLGLCVHNLCDNTALLTAIGNDNGYDEVFARQLQGRCRAGDVLLLFSASGNSPNLLRAVVSARDHGATTIACVGFTGGRLRDLCDLVLHTPNPPGDYGPVEDLHLVLCHFLASHLRRHADPASPCLLG